MTREEAIEMLKKDKEQRGECFISDALDMAIKELEQAKTGHWVEKTGHGVTYIECSECGCLAPSTVFADGVWFKKSNFCHECGARMVEQMESEVGE